MRPDDHGLTLTVERAIAATATCIERFLPAAWHVALSNGLALHATARLADRYWFEFVTAAPTPTQEAMAWSCLLWNAGSAGGPRLVRGSDGLLTLAGDVYLATDPDEIPVEPELSSGVDERIAALSGDMLDAYAALLDFVKVPEDASTRSICRGQGSRAEASAIDRLAALCGEAGWTVSHAPCGHLTVTIAGASDAPAHLQLREAGGFDAIVPLTSGHVVSPICQAAIGLLLLEATASVCTVKGVALRNDEGDHAGLMVLNERGPLLPSAVARALEALSVAAHLVGREIRALETEAIATEYLALRALRQTH